MRWVRQVAVVLGLIVVFDVVGVVLTLGTDVLGATHPRLETSSPLGFVVWFVTGVFCSVAIYGAAGAMDDTSQARRRGGEVLIVTAGCAAVLAVASWPLRGGDLAVAPDSGPLTITYLVTLVVGVACWRFAVFSGDTPPRASYVANEPAPQPVAVLPGTSAPEPTETEVFRPAGVLGTCAWILGMPVLLFLVASFFVLAPFDGLLRPWTDPILTGALAIGPVWGFLAARWETPRDAVLAVFAPVLIGSLFWLFAVAAAGVLVAVFGLPDRVATIACVVFFFAGFLLGLVGLAGWVGDLVVRLRASTADGDVGQGA